MACQGARPPLVAILRGLANVTHTIEVTCLADLVLHDTTLSVSTGDFLYKWAAMLPLSQSLNPIVARHPQRVGAGILLAGAGLAGPLEEVLNGSLEDLWAEVQPKADRQYREAVEGLQRKHGGCAAERQQEGAIAPSSPSPSVASGQLTEIRCRIFRSVEALPDHRAAAATVCADLIARHNSLIAEVVRAFGTDPFLQFLVNPTARPDPLSAAPPSGAVFEAQVAGLLRRLVAPWGLRVAANVDLQRTPAVRALLAPHDKKELDLVIYSPEDGAVRSVVECKLNVAGAVVGDSRKLRVLRKLLGHEVALTPLSKTAEREVLRFSGPPELLYFGFGPFDTATFERNLCWALFGQTMEERAFQHLRWVGQPGTDFAMDASADALRAVALGQPDLHVVSVVLHPNERWPTDDDVQFWLTASHAHPPAPPDKL
jgi:hypothetical protein